jgi:hypothetical protein
MKAIIFGAAVILLAAAAHADDWEARARQCAETIAQQIGGCGSCSAIWPEVSRCTFGRTPVVEKCLHQVNTAAVDKPMGYDRISDVAACLGYH